MTTEGRGGELPATLSYGDSGSSAGGGNTKKSMKAPLRSADYLGNADI